MIGSDALVLKTGQVTSTTWAAHIDDAAVANARGDHADELRITRPLAATCAFLSPATRPEPHAGSPFQSLQVLLHCECLVEENSYESIVEPLLS